MENFSYHDAPRITRVLAPYAGQLIVGFQRQVEGIADEVKNDPSSLDALFQAFHDVAHGLLLDQEINHSDLVHVHECLDALRQKIAASVAEQLGQGEEAALEAA